MDMELLKQALIKVFLGFAIVVLLLFLPAGSFEYTNGWIFIALLFVPMFIAGFILMKKNPDLLRRRLNAKEKQTEQQDIVKYSAIMFIVGFVLAGLNYRCEWNELPDFLVYLGIFLFILSYIMYAMVLKENEFLLRTVEVEKNQKVIDTGLYGIVRHPMYSATIILFLSMPLILNSLFTFIIFLVYPYLIIKRIDNEEKVLEKDLKGYKEYKKKIKYKLIPYIY